MTAEYPEGAIYAAHRLFTGHPFPPEGQWGDILDGPMTDFEAVVEAVREAFKGEPMDRSVLRVWLMPSDRPRADMTALVLHLVNPTQEAAE